MPPRTFAVSPHQVGYLGSVRSASQPVTAAPSGQASRNPALGPANTPSPPRPPARSGSPAATSTRKTSSAAPPRRQPSTEPASMTPSVCSVIGTALPNGVSDPGSPRTATRAAKDAIRARSRDDDRRERSMTARVVAAAPTAVRRPGSGRLRRVERMRSLERGRVQGVAAVQVAVLVAHREPPLALRRGAVRPRLRVHLTLGLLLDPVVADR